MARLDAPRLAGLVGAVVVVAIVSIAESAPSLSASSVPAPELVSAVPALAPTPTPASVLVTEPMPTPELAPAPTSAPASELAPTPTLDPTPAPAPVPAPELAPAPTLDPAPAPIWTRFERPRAIQVRGRQLVFDDLRADGERVAGRRADSLFAPKTPTVLVHYASWCLPCAAELPEVFALARALENISIYKTTRPRITFVSHDEARGPEALLASFEDLLAKAGLTAKDLPPHLGLRADPGDRFAAALTRARLPITDPGALPSLWLLDRHGRLVAHLEGPLVDHERLLPDLGGRQ